jgi:hypothetical protein
MISICTVSFGKTVALQKHQLQVSIIGEVQKNGQGNFDWKTRRTFRSGGATGIVSWRLKKMAIQMGKTPAVVFPLDMKIMTRSV